VGTICKDNTITKKSFLNVYCVVINPTPWNALKLHMQLHNTLYIDACVRERACFEEGGSLQDLKFKTFSHIFEKYVRDTGTEFYRTSSKYLPLCRLTLQNNHEIWSFRHRTTSYSTVPHYVGRITSSVIRSNVNNWYLQESSVLCKSLCSCIFPSYYLCAVQVVRVLRRCMRH
jgi:hypothetical protein